MDHPVLALQVTDIIGVIHNIHYTIMINNATIMNLVIILNIIIDSLISIISNAQTIFIINIMISNQQ